MNDWFLRYEPDDPDAEPVDLPCRILVMGDLGASVDSVLAREGVSLEPEEIDRAMAAAQLCVDVVAENHLLADGSGNIRLQIPVRRRDDLALDAVVAHSPQLQAWQAWVDQIDHVGELLLPECAELAAMVCPCIDAIEARWQAITDRAGEDTARDIMVADLRSRAWRQAEAVLATPQWQRMESAWTGIDWLCAEAVDAASVVLDIWHYPLQRLISDLEEAPSVLESRLAERICEQELGQFGGRPFSAVLIAQAVCVDEPGARFLRALAEVGQHASVSFLLRPEATALGYSSDADAVDAMALADRNRPWLEEAASARWRGVREAPGSRFLALLFPGVVLPAPLSSGHARPVRVHPGFVLTTAMVRHFERHGVPLDPSGRCGESIRALRLMRMRFSSNPLPPLEAALTEEGIARLLSLGIIPVLWQQLHDSLVLGPPVAACHFSNGISGATEADEAVPNLLPYTFLIARVIHYLRIIQRDFIGASSGPEEIERILNGWLRSYVADTDSPAPGLRARRPLRRAAVRLQKQGSVDQLYRMDVEITPHSQDDRTIPTIRGDIRF